MKCGKTWASKTIFLTLTAAHKHYYSYLQMSKATSSMMEDAGLPCSVGGTVSIPSQPYQSRARKPQRCYTGRESPPAMRGPTQLHSDHHQVMQKPTLLTGDRSLQSQAFPPHRDLHGSPGLLRWPTAPPGPALRARNRNNHSAFGMVSCSRNLTTS